jgi:hypothetical protein
LRVGEIVCVWIVDGAMCLDIGFSVGINVEVVDLIVGAFVVVVVEVVDGWNTSLDKRDGH